MVKIAVGTKDQRNLSKTNKARTIVYKRKEIVINAMVVIDNVNVSVAKIKTIVLGNTSGVAIDLTDNEISEDHMR